MNNIIRKLLLLFIIYHIIKNIISLKKIKNNKIKKIINTHWHGRFGNRMFTYAFGCSYAKKYNCIFYYLSEWEGSKLFINNKYAKPLKELDKKLSDDLIKYDGNVKEVQECIKNYNKRTNDDIEFVVIDKNILGKTNIGFNDLNCMYYKEIFDIMDKNFLKNEIFVFNNNVKNTEMYKEITNIKNTYFATHIRNGDICDINFTGSHTCIGSQIKDKILNINTNNLPILIVSEDNNERVNTIPGFDLTKFNNKSKGHKWKQPEGEQYQDEIIFDFLPDFLILINANKLLRTNSSFSWWAAFLNDNEDNIYSPISNENKNNIYVKQNEIKIVKGNYPHFMGSQFPDIIIN